MSGVIGWCPILSLRYRMDLTASCVSGATREAALAFAGLRLAEEEAAADLSEASARSDLTSSLLAAGACGEWAMVAGWCETASDMDVVSYLTESGQTADACVYVCLYRQHLPDDLVARADRLLSAERRT